MHAARRTPLRPTCNLIQNGPDRVTAIRLLSGVCPRYPLHQSQQRAEFQQSARQHGRTRGHNSRARTPTAADGRSDHINYSNQHPNATKHRVRRDLQQPDVAQ